MTFEEEKLLIFDGACGTSLQSLNLPPSAWDRYEGCNEYLNLSAGDEIEALHRRFYDAGAMVVETNTFGGCRIVLAEYGLQSQVEEINHRAVEHAQRARGDVPGRYIAGSVGPTTKLPSLRHISFDELGYAYREQIRALVEAGVDALIIETCQDLLQVKVALLSCFEVLQEVGADLPVLCSVTVETTGTLLGGSDVQAVIATCEPFPIFSLGLNCATGPDRMGSAIRTLGRLWPRRISCIPNAGLPEVEGGRTVYRLSPEAFASALRTFVLQEGVSIVGGCCGTTPNHIRALCEALKDVKPRQREVAPTPALASCYQAVEVVQEIPPLIIGERANTNGSKEFRKRLCADDFEGAFQILFAQEKEGAHLLDLCTAYAGRNEKEDLTQLVRMAATSCRAPLVIDSTDPDCIEACLKLYPGRCMINSVNLEDGGATCDRVCRLAKCYGAALVALTINEKGMAMTAAEKLATAERIYQKAVGQWKLRPWDLFFDPLTFTVGSGDASLVESASESLETIRRIKKKLRGCFTILGISNISFGLPAQARKVLNSVFLAEAVKAGLDAAIVHAGAVVPLSAVSPEEQALCRALIYNERRGGAPPLEAFLAYWQTQGGHAEEKTEESSFGGVPEAAAEEAIIAGRADGVVDLMAILLRRHSPLSIINDILVPAMRRVGDLFASGQLLLPFVLQSAEVMKAAVSVCEPLLEKEEKRRGPRIVLATVQGDVHDIGKNLVDIILSNNGYRVFNLGIKVHAEVLLQKAREVKADCVGLSGLLVKSALVMRENLSFFEKSGLRCPVLLGGAALTPKFVAEECVPRYSAPVVYCKDAFAGLKALREWEAGKLRSTRWEAPAARPQAAPGPRGREIERNVPVPRPPFLGARAVTAIDPALLFPYVNEQALFRGRWGYRRSKMEAEAYKRLVAETVRPLYEELKQKALSEGYLEPKAVYGYFRCFSEGRKLVVLNEGRRVVFSFPRQRSEPYLCITDYFKTEEEGGDLAGFFVVTLGARIGEEIAKLFTSDRYHDYLILHGFSVEVTDALAEYWHEVMRKELGLASETA